MNYTWFSLEHFSQYELHGTENTVGKSSLIHKTLKRQERRELVLNNLKEINT